MVGNTCRGGHGSLVGHRRGDRARARPAGLALRAARAPRRPARARSRRRSAASGRSATCATGRRSTRSPRACSSGIPRSTLLVNNAGVPGRGTSLDVDPETIERVIETNYLGGVWCTRAFLPGLRSAAAAGDAHVVNVVSVAGTVAFAPAGAYAASKHAQLAFSRSLAATLRPEGIQVHTIMPGLRRDRGLPPALEPPQRAHAPLRDRARTTSRGRS